MLKYLENQFLYEDKAKVIEIFKNENGQDVIILDSTIFYPKGGGQPSDTGFISAGDENFLVEDVRIIDNKVNHIGFWQQGQFTVGQEVALQIDVVKRVLHSKIHTLGHLLDEAVIALGYTDLLPDKGFHYPEGPSVSYKGKLERVDLETVKQNIENEVNRMLAVGFETKAFFISADEVEKYCHKITVDPTIFGGNNIKDLRVVVVWGELGITCGGTHVKNINEISGIKITKLSNKKGIVKISYQLS